MSRILRIVLVLVFLAGVVALGMQGKAWASKMATGGQMPASAGADQNVLLGSRPLGTSGPTTPLVAPLTSDQPVTVGSCATVTVKSAPAGVSYTASIVAEADLPTALPGKLQGCGVKVEAVTSPSLGAQTLVCWPLLPLQGGFAYYYDGSKWVKTTSQTSDGQVCANVVPGTAPNPAFVAVFDK